MAEATESQTKRGTGTPPPVAQPGEPEGTQRGQPAETQTPRHVDAERVPNFDVTADPRWALGFLVRIYDKAKERKVLNTLPGWIEPDSRSLSTVFNPARNARFAYRATRDSILQAVVKDLVESRQLSAQTSQSVDDLRRLFERETVLGTSYIERTAANWMKATLAASRTKVLRILVDANARPHLVTRAAALVLAKLPTTNAPIRGDAEYAVVKPKHQRYWRDGAMENRLLHLRYIAATRRCIQELLERQERIEETDVDPGQEVRGLVRVPPDRMGDRKRRLRETQSGRELTDALKIIDALTWHPKAVRMIDAWAKGPDKGIPTLASVVNDSVVAIDKLSAKLAGEPSIVWNFPASLRGGIASLNIIEQDPLTQYSLVWAGAVQPALDTALKVLGDLISALELFGGPLAPIAGIADAILQAVSTAVSVLKELDQDHAETATEFEKESDRLSTGGKYGDAVVQGVGALLAAKVVPGDLRKLTRRTPKPGAPPPSPPRPSKATDPGAISGKQAQQGTETLGGGPPIKSGERLADRPPSGEHPKVQPPSSQQPSAISTSKGSETFWAADRKTPKRNQLDDEDLANVKQADETAQVEGKRGTRADLDRPASGATKAATLPTSIRQRISLGRWERKGKLNFNEDGIKFTGKSKTARQLDPDEFEQGFNQQLAKPYADRLSNKPVRKDVEWLPGYESPSSGRTNRLKMQKTRRGDLLRRRPEATMEVVENIPGGGSKVAEAHFFEATMQSEFKAADAFHGHKQKQISGTVWLSSELARKGYTPDTRMYYHIFSPFPPGQATIDYLNRVMEEYPNLEINWLVVQ